MRRLGTLLIAIAVLGVATPAGAATAPPAAKSASAKSTATKPAATPAPAVTIVRRHPAPSGPQPSFALYQSLLTQYVTIEAPPDSGLQTAFNYEYWFDEKGRDDRARKIREEFLAVSPATMDRTTRLAWAINFYNYLVIETATSHLLIPLKYRTRYKSVRDMRINDLPFFTAELVKVDSVDYSLDAFEKHFVWEDFDRKPDSKSPDSLDERIHFAVVCGAKSCPSLQPRAFKPESLDRQLDKASRDFLRGSRGIAWDAKGQVLRLSSIFYWYHEDFGGRDHLLEWAAKYAPKSKQSLITSAQRAQRVAAMDYDWLLNQSIGWRYDMMMARPLTGTPKAVPDSMAR
jgi:hypothetical protein